MLRSGDSTVFEDPYWRAESRVLSSARAGVAEVVRGGTVCVLSSVGSERHWEQSEGPGG